MLFLIILSSFAFEADLSFRTDALLHETPGQRRGARVAVKERSCDVGDAVRHQLVVGGHLVVVPLAEQLRQRDVDGERDDGDTDGVAGHLAEQVDWGYPRRRDAGDTGKRQRCMLLSLNQAKASFPTLQSLPLWSLKMAPLLQIELSITAVTRMHCRVPSTIH